MEHEGCVQIKILTETQMTSSEIRRMKLVFKDMKHLIERGGGHLTKQEHHISLEKFSQILAHSHILFFHMMRVSVFSSIFNSQYNTSLIVRFNCVYRNERLCFNKAFFWMPSYEILECRRNTGLYEFHVQHPIDVDRLLNGLPNIERIDEQRWNFRNSRDQIMQLLIVRNYFHCKASSM
uniref:FBA_2 domain-containing protein n=1 Tax=Heterorhabditis bacteriophora TaxID=37862 RepID=A0A1I7WIN5_HETBA